MLYNNTFMDRITQEMVLANYVRPFWLMSYKMPVLAYNEAYNFKPWLS